MSCGCKTSGDSGHSCGTKSATGCENVNICGNSYKLSVFDWLSNIKTPNQQNEDEYIEVRFKNERKLFFKNPNKMPLHIGSIVTVESNPGHDVGVVSLTGELVKIQMKKKKFPVEQALKIYRIANQKDVETWQALREKENATKKEAKIIASRLGLEMKITDVEYQGDGAKATFYYTADSRVDFRQLIKEFATLFKTKIDMKQIGFRQESAKIGGIGSCGRELCCSSWLTDFRSVNTNAARYQQLSINPQKLAGQCGKLKCCLNFELDSYLDALTDFPSSSTTLDTEKGKAFCIKIDVFKKKMWFAYAENPVAWYDIDVRKVKQQIDKNKKGIKASNLEDLVSDNGFATKTVDLIQEDSADRFEKKGRQNRKPNNKNRKDRPAQNNPNAQQKTPQQKVEGNHKPQERKQANPNNQKGKRPFKKNSFKNNNSNNNE